MNISDSQLKQSPPIRSYDKGYKWLHWLMAALVGLMFFALLGFNETMTDNERTEMLVGHSSLGIIISLLMALRVFKRFVKRDPTPKHVLRPWQAVMSKAVQLGLYASLITVPLSGFLSAQQHALPVKAFGFLHINRGLGQNYEEASFMLIRQFHEWGIKALMVLLVLHISAAIFHRWVQKDQVLASMTKIIK